MLDHAAELLLDCMHQQTTPGVCVIDEAFHTALPQLPRSEWYYITNRFDLQAELSQLAEHARVDFSDFDLSGYDAANASGIFFRIAKEKAVNHFLVNQAIQRLQPGQLLCFSGYKQDGIKSLIDRVSGILGKPHQIITGSKTSRLAVFVRSDEAADEALDDQQYQALREIVRIDERPIFSKPGQFGWDKIDQGSAFLFEHLAAVATPEQAAEQQVLDLGCGYGYLTLMAGRYGFQRLTATDNNAAALLACQHNIEHWSLPAEVIADDCASHIDQRFDVILCNPPFHRGFDATRDITVHFLEQIHAHMQRSGSALLVVNKFIQIEQPASRLFNKCERVADNKQFKLIKLTSPK